MSLHSTDTKHRKYVIPFYSFKLPSSKTILKKKNNEQINALIATNVLKTKKRPGTKITVQFEDKFYDKFRDQIDN